MGLKFYSYRITNELNGKSYIGIASGDPQRRWRQHKFEANKSGSHLPLYKAMKKYGTKMFRFEVVYEADSWEEVCKKERELITGLGTLAKQGGGYNLAEGGQGPFGVERSEVTRKLIAQKTLQWFERNPEAREYLRQLGKQQMANPDRRELSRQAARKQWNDPSLAAKSRESLSVCPESY
jgi:group I intron endonuclease